MSRQYRCPPSKISSSDCGRSPRSAFFSPLPRVRLPVHTTRMATLASAQLPSDDEGDTDFVLDKKSLAKLHGDQDASSGSDSSSDGDGSSRKRKRRKLNGAEGKESNAEPVVTKEAIDDLWASFNDDSNVESSSGKAGELVTIKRTFKFAGDVSEREVQVMSNSQEAIEYFAKLKEEGEGSTVDSQHTISNQDTTSPTPITPNTSLDKSSVSISSNIPSAISSATKLPARQVSANAPRRKKGGLAALSAKLAAGQNPKPTKLTTLEKSKMDWESYVSKEKLADDLETSRKSKNGYLEKQDFLARSEQHKEEEYDRLKSAASGRRRPG